MLAAIQGTLQIADYAVLVAYILGMMLIGVRFSRSTGSAEDYLLGGRGIGWRIAGISHLMTLFSTLSMVAIPGTAYDRGVTLALQTFIAPIVAVIAFNLFIRFYFKTRAFTPFDYLERRFDWRIRALSAGFYWLARVVYLGLALYATALVFQGACGWPKHYTIMLTAGVGVTYTLLGGLRAVAWADLMQFLVLVGGIGLLLFKAVGAVPGGVSGVLEYAFANGRGTPELHDPSFYSMSPMVPVTLFGLVLLIVNEQFFFNSADQLAIQRLLSTSGYTQARRSLYTSVFLAVPVGICLWFIGLAMFGFYGHMPADQRPLRGDLALYHFIGTQLPPPLPGLIIAAMLAAVMSTLAGGYNSLTTVITTDFYLRFLRPGATEVEQVSFSRWATLIIGAMSVVLGLVLSRLTDTTGNSVLENSFVWLSMSVALPPVFLLGILSRRAKARHALVALGIGWVFTAGTIAWHETFVNTSWAISPLFVGIPGPAAALLMAWLFTRASPRQSTAKLQNLTLWTLCSEHSSAGRAGVAESAVGAD